MSDPYYIETMWNKTILNAFSRCSTKILLPLKKNWSFLDSLKGFSRKTVFVTDVTSHFSQNENISPAACL